MCGKSKEEGGARKRSGCASEHLRARFPFFACSLPLLQCSTVPTLLSGRVGKARAADFKSQPEGEAETSYLVEWTSLSYTPITEFRLEVRREGGEWAQHSLPATEACHPMFTSPPR